MDVGSRLSYKQVKQADPRYTSYTWRSMDLLLPEPVRDFLYDNWYEYRSPGGVQINLNYWSWVHFLAGFAFALVFKKATVVVLLIVHTIWELLQIAIGMSDIFNDTVNEAIDIAFDTGFSLAGFGVCRLILPT